jgi:hypothetical protein
MDAEPVRAVVAGIEWSLTGHAKVQCDECRDVYTTHTWKFPTPEERVKLAAELREAGWIVEGDHQRHVCPRCVQASR